LFFVSITLVFMATGHKSLSYVIAHRFHADDDLLLPLRRFLWVLRRTWIPFSLGGRDVSFDFLADLSPHEAGQIISFIYQRKNAVSRDTFLGDLAHIAARRLAENPESPHHEREFTEAITSLISDLPGPLDVEFHKPHKQKKKRRVGRENARTALHDLNLIFPVEEMRWFVLSGTFLGLVREGSFLPHDYDIDIGIFEADVLPAMLDRIKSSGKFTLRKLDIQPGFPGDDLAQPRPMIAKVIHHTGIPIDIFVHYHTPDGRIVHGTSLHHWFNSPFEVTEYDFEGIQVLGPANADTYLTENYGNWRTPVTDFDCSIDTTNVSIVRHPVTLVHFFRRMVRGYVLEMNDGPRLAAKLVAHGIVKKSDANEPPSLGSNLWGRKAP